MGEETELSKTLSSNETFLLQEGIFTKSTLGITEKEVERVYSQAKQLYDAGKFEDAKTLFSVLVLIDAQSPAVLYGFASACLMLKQYEEAIEAFLEYAGFVPSDPLPYFFIAACYEKKQDYVSTLIALQTVVNRAGEQAKYQEIKNRALLTFDAVKGLIKEYESQHDEVVK
ncbi:putative regulatory protein lcrH and chaperone sycD [Chlamydiales bacterium STE3]|nr:putative regulatory protein lcrH and chaperone sycD [Chlamydiales bacterium STE3]